MSNRYGIDLPITDAQAEEIARTVHAAPRHQKAFHNCVQTQCGCHRLSFTEVLKRFERCSPAGSIFLALDRVAHAVKRAQFQNAAFIVVEPNGTLVTNDGNVLAHDPGVRYAAR